MATKNEVAAQIMEHLCTHDWHGYTQGNRWGDGGTETLTIDEQNYTIATGDHDCSSAVISAYQAAGVPVKDCGATYTGNMVNAFLATGMFEWKPMSFIAQRGDVYLNQSCHTAMCTSPNPDMLAEFSISENGGIYGQVGDQTGWESHITNYYNYPWDGILHYIGEGQATGNSGSASSGNTSSNPGSTKIDIKYRGSTDPNGRNWLDEMTNHVCSDGCGDDYAGILGSPLRWLAISMSGWYQVKSEANGWLDPVRGYDINDLENGCEGDGSPITAVRCYYETQDPNTTGWLVIEFQVHVMDEDNDWYPLMHDLTDTGGSSDDFAGNGSNYIDGFRAVLVSE